MSQGQILKLTALSSCAGCASKLSQDALTHVLCRLSYLKDRNTLVGATAGDDAGVYRIGADTALVQTTDFFTPIVNDPYAYGQIAATNALSDIYAMGGRPLTALNLVGVPATAIDLKTVNRILKGGATKLKEAKCVLLGGHTIRNPEPIYGLALTGVVSPRRMLTNANARPGDVLVLTKAIGTGIITTGIKRGLTSRGLEKKVIALMSRLNDVGRELGEHGLVKAAVDVTGFGLLGHLGAMCRSSRVGAKIAASRVPVVDETVFDLIAADCVPGGSRDNLRYANRFVEWGTTSNAFKCLLTDAQTSGGLLLAVPKGRLETVMNTLIQRHFSGAVAIGQILESAKPRIKVEA